MSSIIDWAILTTLYLSLHVVFLNALSPGLMEILVVREYGPQFIGKLAFAIVNCLQTFAAVILVTLFSRWWMDPGFPSLALLLSAILPGLIILQLLRFAGESGLVTTLPELVVNLCIALFLAYEAISIGFRLSLAS